VYVCVCVYIYIVTKLNSIITRIKSSSRGSILILSGYKRRVGFEFFSGSKIEKSTTIPKDLSLNESYTAIQDTKENVIFYSTYLYRVIKKKIKWVTLQYRNLT